VATMLCHARKTPCTYLSVHEYIEIDGMVCELHALKCVYRILAHHACCDALRIACVSKLTTAVALQKLRSWVRRLDIPAAPVARAPVHNRSLICNICSSPILGTG
jgi:hypothetical protein